MKTWTSEDGGFIKDSGSAYVKRPSVVYMWQTEEDCIIETDVGVMEASVGDIICYDELSGHVWPITQDYFDLHYVELKDA